MSTLKPRSAGRNEAKQIRELCQALLLVDSEGGLKRFLTDLCTPGELAALADRWAVARLLDRGVAYRKIHEKMGVSTATVTRVARSLERGEGGYRAVLDQLTAAKEQEP